MRVIKFRGKTGTGNWVYGDLTFSRYGNPYIGSLSKKWSGVKKETVGQYTGMTDRKGREIYEGDIIKIAQTYGIWRLTWGDGIGKIWWNADKYRFSIEHKTHDNEEMNEYKSGEVEVIGNIHENPELLGGADSD